jgi:hypothetical protein
MTIIFTFGKRTSDNKQTHVPHAGTVPQVKKVKNDEVIVPAEIGEDGLLIEPVKKDFWLRELRQRREREL